MDRNHFAGRKWDLKRPSRRILLALIVCAVLVKLVLAVVTPVSYDLVFYLQLAEQNPAIGPTPSYWKMIFRANPIWVSLFTGVYNAWLVLPVAHPETKLAWTTGSLLYDPSLHLLFLMFKSPMLVADLLVGYLLYRFSKRIPGLEGSALVVSLAWFANPYSTFASEMNGALDIIPTLFIILALFLLQIRRRVLGSLSITISIAMKLYGILVAPQPMFGLSSIMSRRRKAMILVLPIFGLLFWRLRPFRPIRPFPRLQTSFFAD